MFITLLSLSRSLARVAEISHWTKWISLNNEPCLTRPNLWTSNELHYYPFMASLDGFSESYNAIDDWSSVICVPNKTENQVTLMWQQK